jgi:dTDP-4-dehydrorhamnose reductase
MHKILVTGGNGQLGQAIIRAAQGSNNEYITLSRSEADICNYEMMDSLLSVQHFNIVINCAAYTNVDGAEDNIDEAQRINGEGVATLAQVCKRHNARLIHISTDYVFGDGPAIGSCREDDETHPVSIYGQTKRQGEQAVVASGCHYLIIRTSWLYSEFGRNFVKTMIALISQKDSVKVVSDQIGTPTYALDLAEVIYEIVSGRRYEGQDGIYHYSNDGVCSWFDFAGKIAEYVGNSSCEIIPCTTEEYPSKVRRPAYSVLDKTKIKNTFGLRIPAWTESLKKCIKNLK